MGERAQALAEGFDQANGEMIAVIERLTDAQWQAMCASEGWTVGVTAHHVAEDHALLAAAIQSVAIGLPMPRVTDEMVNQINAKHAQQHAGCTKEDTLALLRKNGVAAATILRMLSNEQLDKTAPHPFRGGEPWQAEQLVEDVMIGHVRLHLQSIQAAASM